MTSSSPTPQSAELGAPPDHPRIQVEVHLDPSDDDALRRELRESLQEAPRRIPSKLFYDDEGSHFFELICELPEYYQTRTEGALLASLADRLIAMTGAQELVEMGSGAATKTRVLLDAMKRAGTLRCYVPLDVSEGIVRRVALELVEEYPEIQVHAVVGDFMDHLDELPTGDHRLVIFLGGTIGNLRPAAATALLTELHRAMAPGDHFLLGTDLIKDVARLEAAYDDSQGVTAEFNRNILNVVNRLGGGDFRPEAFRHRAFYNRQNDWIEMRLVAERAMTVALPALGLDLDLEEGEEILTEISAKYDRPRAEALLTGAGFEFVDWFTDPDDLFALSLAVKG